MSQTQPRTVNPYLASLLSLFSWAFPTLVMAQSTSAVREQAGRPSSSSVQQQPMRRQPPATLLNAQAKPFTPSNPGLPGRRQPASPRGPCFPNNEKPLTALVPKDNLGLTAIPHPSFFFYIPETPATTVQFVLVDEEINSKIYQTTFPITGTAGIVSFRLPNSQNSPSLKLGKKYHWYFSVVCDPNDRSGDIYVDGWVQRVGPNPVLESELKNASVAAQIRLYKQHNLWQDALTTLTEQRRFHPNDSTLSAEWTMLLRSVELDEFAQEPLIEP